MAFRVTLGCIGALAFGSTMVFQELAGCGAGRRVVDEDDTIAAMADPVLTLQRVPGGHLDDQEP
ncbi:MAG: hypothetical protein K2X52_18230 [Mycobacteriaceae bacterium]|nr:hypothetical protein [Mycobacteriaceae bacterium]